MWRGLADEKQARRVSGLRERGAVNAGENGAPWILHSDSPQVADTKGIGLRVWVRGVMKIEAVVVEVLGKLRVVFPTKEGEKLCSCLRDFHPELSLLV